MMLEEFTPSFFKRLQQLKIKTRRVFLGTRQGAHRSLRRGHGLEFADYRLYAPGDDFRHIDWGVYGRTDRLYVRQFREEQELNVIFLIDTSASMGVPAEDKKFNLARSLALALGYVALSDGDNVTFSLLGSHNSPKYTGPRALRQAATFLETATLTKHFDLKSATLKALQKQRIPGKCFFISDFLVEDQERFAAIDLIRSRNFDLTLLQILSTSEISLTLPAGQSLVIDSETGEELELSLDQASRKEYATLIASHISSLEGYCQQTGVRHVLIKSTDNASEIVLKRFPALGLLI